MVKVGDRVTRVLDWSKGYDRETKKNTFPPTIGTVVYVHPRGYFHTVEFQMRGGPIRECFPGV